MEERDHSEKIAGRADLLEFIDGQINRLAIMDARGQDDGSNKELRQFLEGMKVGAAAVLRGVPVHHLGVVDNKVVIINSASALEPKPEGLVNGMTSQTYVTPQRMESEWDYDYPEGDKEDLNRS